MSGSPTNKLFKKAVLKGTRLIKKGLELSQKPMPPWDGDPNAPAVAVDVMGGDHAPYEIIKGAIRAAREYGVPVQLVGSPEKIARVIGRLDISGLPIEIVPATDSIGMDDKQPVLAVRRKPQASIVVAMRQVAQGRASAVVSAGSTGAVAAAALLILKRIKGIERPGIGVVIPSSKTNIVLIDAGANVDSTPVQIAQHAIMASIFASQVLEQDSPRVGLLNIGEEAGKGNAQSKLTYELLSKLSVINFIGNVEGRTLSEHHCDVLVTDGFIGNVFLKTLEGSIKMMLQMLHQELTKSIDLKMGAMICRPAFSEIKNNRLNYARYGGAMLLGVRGPVVIAHGISNDFAIMNAIVLAQNAVKAQVVQQIEAKLSLDELEGLLCDQPCETEIIENV